MTEKRRITDARADSKGNISHVKFSGNQNFTPIEQAIKQTEAGQVEGAHVVHPKGGDKYLRTNPDGKKGNNLDEMAGDS
jgi:hypothetical protein